MSRHRIVRRMNYEDECYDEDDDYGHSYEDRYCISPSTAAQFTYNRDRDLSLSSYMQDEIPEDIPEETEMDIEPEAVQEAAGAAAGTELTDVDKARLQSCAEEVHNIMGDTIPESVVTETILRHNFNLETALNELLSRRDAPKSQRTPKKKRDRAQGDDESIDDLLSEIDALDQQETIFIATGCRLRFGAAASPPSAISVPKKSDSRRSGDRSSPAISANSPDSVAVGLSLSEMTRLSTAHKTSGRLRNISVGSDYSSSDVDSLTSSSPQQTAGLQSGKSLMELIQQHQSSELVVRSSSNLIVAQPKADTSSSQCEKSSVSTEGGKKTISGLSLSDLIAAQNNLAATVGSSAESAQSSAKKPSSGMSLSELIAVQSQKSSTSLSSLSSSSSQAKERSGLSLTDLVNRHSSQKSPAPSAQDGVDTSAQSTLATQGLSLSDLVKSRSGSGKKSGPDCGSSPSPSTGLSLADLAKSRTSGQSSAKRDPASDQKMPQTGLSLSDLIKQRQGDNAKPAVLSEQGKQLISGSGISKPVASLTSENQQAADKSRSKPDIVGTKLADSLRQGLVLGGHQLEVTKEEGRGDVGLSLAGCLKKPVTARPMDKTVRQTQESPTEEMEEEKSPLSSEKSADIDVDFFTSAAVDPAMKRPPSLFARCICLRLQLVPGQKRKLDAVLRSSQTKVKYPKYQFNHQTRKLITLTEAPLHNVEPFDFATPSPDDVVKMRQKAAFTRTGQQAEEGKT